MNTPMPKVFRSVGNLCWLVSCLAVGSLQAADGWTLYRTKPGTNNLVKVEGTSTLHDWRCISRNIIGALETGPAFALDPAKLKPADTLEMKVTVSIPVRSLKSVDAKGKPYSEAMDNVMYEKMRAEQFKLISYNLTELTVRELPSAPGAPFKLLAKGTLGVAGMTNTIEMPVELVRTGAMFKITGGVPTRMTDFNVEPPVVAVIKTGNDVRLSFAWLAEVKK